MKKILYKDPSEKAEQIYRIIFSNSSLCYGFHFRNPDNSKYLILVDLTKNEVYKIYTEGNSVKKILMEDSQDLIDHAYLLEAKFTCFEGRIHDAEKSYTIH